VLFDSIAFGFQVAIEARGGRGARNLSVKLHHPSFNAPIYAASRRVGESVASSAFARSF
jgi:uncharacterized protein (DUF736 family)